MPEQVQISNDFSPLMPVVLAGTMYNGKPNFMAVGWCMRTNMAPPMLTIGIGKNKATAEAIMQNNCFSICVPSAKHKDGVDFCGLVSGKKIDKSNVFACFTGINPNCPLVRDFPVNLECTLEYTQELPDHYLFTAEITRAWARKDILENGKPHIENIAPLVLTMNDNRYWQLGGDIGLAWRDGLKMKRANEQENL